MVPDTTSMFLVCCDSSWVNVCTTLASRPTTMRVFPLTKEMSSLPAAVSSATPLTMLESALLMVTRLCFRCSSAPLPTLTTVRGYEAVGVPAVKVLTYSTCTGCDSRTPSATAITAASSICP
jgi:hypothetical protein